MQSFIPFRSSWPDLIVTNLDIAVECQEQPKDMADESHDFSTTIFFIHHRINDDVADIFIDACASLYLLISFHFLLSFHILGCKGSTMLCQNPSLLNFFFSWLWLYATHFVFFYFRGGRIATFNHLVSFGYQTRAWLSARQDTLLLFVHLVCNEANTDMHFYPFLSEMKDRACLQITPGYTKDSFYNS